MERHGWNGWNAWHGPITSRNQEPQKIMQKIENFENLKFVPIIILDVPVVRSGMFDISDHRKISLTMAKKHF